MMVGPGHGAAPMAGFCGEDSSSAVMAWLQLCTAASGVRRNRNGGGHGGEQVALCSLLREEERRKGGNGAEESL
jgi:hypothetical protein